jgi:hypothetical protein
MFAAMVELWSDSVPVPSFGPRWAPTLDAARAALKEI